MVCMLCESTLERYPVNAPFFYARPVLHIRNIYAKLHVHSRVRAVVKAVNESLISARTPAGIAVIDSLQRVFFGLPDQPYPDPPIKAFSTGSATPSVGMNHNSGITPGGLTGKGCPMTPC